MKWFGSIALFLHKYEDSRRIPKYELRTTICYARSRKIAEARFLKEFKDYAQGGISFVNEWEVFDIDGVPGKIPIEAAYQMITSDLTPKQFIKAYWLGDRPQSCEEKGWTHAWHNFDDKHSACYNCRTIKKGQHWKKSPNQRVQRIAKKTSSR